jgi:hypothetical protein
MLRQDTGTPGTGRAPTVFRWNGIGATALTNRSSEHMKTALVIGALALMGLSANAQNDQPSATDKAWVAINTQMLNVDLGLNDTQQAKLKDINERYVTKHEALENSVPKLSESQMADKVEALMKERDRELRTVFNDEQYAKWEKKRHMGTSELRDDQKEKMKK